ncbi:TetR/AcrR family transcriptional regulator [Ensifer sp. ENS04]|uniref:TetR family transcriptional regulator n=1 Tax=Ensifer sp. ENS04 TaxID=2769281 RepID=UPI00177E6B92|nr:TetR/AcrR family transcriptional regulator [Ensifer sp. ENS04]
MQEITTEKLSLEIDARERIMLAARHVFARSGFELGTVRDITEMAQVNTAAVNYYFRSKDELIRAVFDDGLKPIIRVRLQALENCVSQASPDLPTLPSVAEALVRPLVELSSGEYRDVMLLLMHARTRANDLTAKIVVENFTPVHEKFVDVLSKLLPELARSEVAFRYDCARGAILQTLVDLAPAVRLVAGAAHFATPNDEVIVARLVRFVTAGLAAPSAG